MRFVCLSAFNGTSGVETEAAQKACNLVRDLVKKVLPAATFDIIQLMDFDPLPCVGCNGCIGLTTCIRDQAFNLIYSRMIAADGVFIVSPGKATIPAKLAIVLDKIEQMTVLQHSGDPNYTSPLKKKPVGIVTHQTGVRTLAMPSLGAIASAVGYPVEMELCGAGMDCPTGVALVAGEEQGTDWDATRRMLEPLVWNVCMAAGVATMIRPSDA